jgi:predicted RND superfamily exporter protein
MQFLNKNFTAKLILIFSLFFVGCVRVDDSMQIFFPKEVNELQLVQTEFSAFWWNFIVVEPDRNEKTTPNFKSAKKICSDLRSRVNKELRMVVCDSSFSGADKVLNSWAQDITLRQKFDNKDQDQYLAAFSTAMIQASYVSDKKVFSLIRNDPFQSWQSYVDLSKNTFLDFFKRQEGFLTNTKTGNIIIPAQFQVSPKAEAVQPIMDIILPYKNVFLIGAHGSTYQNQTQVHKDLTIVSWISLIVFVGLIAFLVLKSSLRILLLTIPVSAAVYLAMLITQLIDGSIHGLTLAFGSGIIGLALDYGLHGAFGTESKQTWMSNFVGLITTMCGVFILILSGIPLIRQMMIFSSIGLGLGFAMYYFVFKFFPDYFKIKDFNFYLPQIKYSKLVVIALILLGFFGLSKSEVSINLQKPNHTSTKESELITELFDHQKSIDTFLSIKPLDTINSEIFSEKKWADEFQIEYEGVGKYLPDLAQQKNNEKTWIDSGCVFFKNKLSADAQKIFSPFGKYICDLKIDSENTSSIASLVKEKPYLSHLIGTKHILSILSSKDESQSAIIKAKFPEAKSLTQSLKGFSQSLENDLSWMIPVSLLLTLLILGIYYRKIKPVVTAVVPFFTGVGLYFLVARLKGLDVDLISILGLIIVFGFSIDYGVFSTDAHIHGETENEIKQVYSALSIAAVTNIIGFFPMLFAGHPVLSKLGYVLFFGTLGTYLGTIYGVYPSYSMKNKSLVT